MPEKLLEGLNQKQKEAVTTTEGPVLILAGPGSGKTRVLTHRVAYLLEKGVDPRNILAVTFTNKAAEEMKERIRSLVASRNSELPLIGTFHSICARWLRSEIKTLGFSGNFTIYDADDSRSLLKKVMKELQITEEQFKLNLVKEVISRAKNELVDEKLYQLSAFDYFPQTISKIYSLYQRRLKETNALDFDDLILLTVKILQDRPEILAKYQNRYRYILVDEYQDTNLAQYTLINLLARQDKNLFVIGDEAQSVYSWRGADFRNILNFENDYPEAKIILLEQNYRSSQTILDAAYHIIQRARQKKDKKLWTENKTGNPLVIFEAASEREESDFIVQEIISLQNKERLKLKDFVVLYRTNAQSRNIEEAFLRAGIPYKIIGGFKFYERKEIKDVLAYLKFLQNPKDFVSLERIINTPPRGIGQKAIEKLAAASWDLALPLPALKKFRELIEELDAVASRQKLSFLVKKTIELAGLKNFLLDGTEEGINRFENIQELLTVTKKYDQEIPPRGLELFLEEVSLLTDQDELETQKDQVNLMTLHCAKGLEFSSVFIVGCEEGVFPHSRSLGESGQLEEERRLCYVGITRAKKHLFLLHARQRNLYGGIQVNPPSRFLQEIPAELVERKQGRKIKSAWMIDEEWDDEVEAIEYD